MFTEYDTTERRHEISLTDYCLEINLLVELQHQFEPRIRKMLVIIKNSFPLDELARSIDIP